MSAATNGKVVKSAVLPVSTSIPTPPTELSAAEKLHEAVQFIRQAQTDLEKLKAQYSPNHAAHAQCEVIDDHLFEALRLLGQ